MYRNWSFMKKYIGLLTFVVFAGSLFGIDKYEDARRAIKYVDLLGLTKILKAGESFSIEQYDQLTREAEAIVKDRTSERRFSNCMYGLSLFASILSLLYY